jgi:hypothetical protein
MTGETIWVRVVDDHAVVREGYRRLLELNADVQMCGEAPRCRAGRPAALRIAAPISSHQVTKQLHVFASVTMLLDERYASFGALGHNFFNGPNHSFGRAVRWSSAVDRRGDSLRHT